MFSFWQLELISQNFDHFDDDEDLLYVSVLFVIHLLFDLFFIVYLQNHRNLRKIRSIYRYKKMGTTFIQVPYDKSKYTSFYARITFLRHHFQMNQRNDVHYLFDSCNGKIPRSIVNFTENNVFETYSSKLLREWLISSPRTLFRMKNGDFHDSFKMRSHCARHQISRGMIDVIFVITSPVWDRDMNIENQSRILTAIQFGL